MSSPEWKTHCQAHAFRDSRGQSAIRPQGIACLILAGPGYGGHKSPMWVEGEDEQSIALSGWWRCPRSEDTEHIARAEERQVPVALGDD